MPLYINGTEVDDFRVNGVSMDSGVINGTEVFTAFDPYTDDPVPIGTFWEGGYYAGKIQQDDGVYALIVAPKSQGGDGQYVWKTDQSTTAGAASLYDGLSNTNAMIAAGASAHPAANFCNNLSINGYNDWYLPAKDELEILYRYLKPTIDANNTSYGANSNSVPTTSNYTSSDPAQTSVSIFQEGNTEALLDTYYWSSTDYTDTFGLLQKFSSGDIANGYKMGSFQVRAVRRVKL